MDWILKRKWYIDHKVIHGMIYDSMGDEVCHTLENMEPDENGLPHCLPEGVYKLTNGMLKCQAGAYNMTSARIVVGLEHNAHVVKDCLLHSGMVYNALTHRITMWNKRHPTEPLMLTII